ncbi:FAD-binding oxidoreductase [Pelomonas sp. Root1444]|uniref:NAD(P)/FAD-dependent oxidoreductase n=1 Tax=Pelomonas sp. Root1444 TaxID=1736464 RepID=UPI0007026FC2|nr:FAD-binding oxidoreductase [Pelomonas sp. Root1444]KQY90735.1 FAD-dependent oxidoreductase [Pelomonas sp. Root1444]
MKLASYWLETSEPFKSGAQGPVEGRCDVAVIGGGLTGCSTALALAKKGARVVLLEAESIGHAASGRNGGMCNNGFAQDYGAMSARLGKDVADRLYRAFDAGVDTVERLVAEERIDCNFARVGKIKLAVKPEHYDKLARNQALLAANVDPDTHMVSRAGLADEVGSDCFHGGLVYRKSAGMHVGRFVRGLAEAAARRGVEIHERTPMTGLRPDPGGGHLIDTPKGRLHARQVMLASGTSHVGPLGWIRRRIVPVGAFLIVTEPLPQGLLDQLLPRRRMAVDTKNLVNYFRTTPDNRLLFGGRARFAISNPNSDAKSGAILRAALHQVFPQVRDARIDYCWGGMVDMTRDRLPRAGERNGIYYSMGYSGHGTQMSTLMGTVMAEIMDGRTELNPWKDFTWPAIPGHFGPPWFLPLVGACYRIKDRFA